MFQVEIVFQVCITYMHNFSDPWFIQLFWLTDFVLIMSDKELLLEYCVLGTYDVPSPLQNS